MPSLVNALKVPYEGFIGEKRIGLLFLNPFNLELYPESKSLLEELGYKDITIKDITDYGDV